jgi:pimeloyl-ACP methyl ester carboxylesterase
LQKVVADMIELHEALGAEPALWIGQDWGSPVVGALASQHPDRCRAVAMISVPYIPRGFAVSNLIELIDRKIYPSNEYPVGQWDYYVFYQESFDQAAGDYEADVAATLAFLYRPGSPDSVGKPALTASVRGKGDRFGPSRRAPVVPRELAMLSQPDFDRLVLAFCATSFRAPNSWYMNDPANIAYCSNAPNEGRLTQPVLFLGGAWDGICDTAHGRLAEPMRSHCANLTEVTIDGGHWLMLDRPAEVNEAMAKWLARQRLL